MNEENKAEKKGKYIYGIIPKNSDLSNLYEIVNNGGVHTISNSNLSALVADLEIVDYTHLSKEVLTEHLLLHQKTIEDAMNLGNTIVPFKLGTFVKDEHEVKHILHTYSDLIEGIIEKITGKIEFHVVVVWNNFPSTLKKIGEEKKISEFKESLKIKSDQITEEDRIQVGHMVKLALAKKNTLYSKKILDAISPACQDVKIHEILSDQIVFNASFILNKQDQLFFNETITKLNTKFNKDLDFRYIGPRPCYSFYSIEVNRICFTELDQARKKLRLPYTATKEEIKKAYKNMAFSMHPDRKIGERGSDEEFNDLNRAYNVLLDYCFSAKVSKERKYSLLEEDINENSLLIKLRS